MRNVLAIAYRGPHKPKIPAIPDTTYIFVDITNDDFRNKLCGIVFNGVILVDEVNEDAEENMRWLYSRVRFLNSRYFNG